MLRIFIGYDSREAIAYHVLSHSLLKRASRPLEIIPLARNLLGGLYTRPRESNESTEFSLTRFLVPYLSGYNGYSIFMDCDMLCLADIGKVIDYINDLDEFKGVWVCQHDYIPRTTHKFLGHEQTVYPRKNWSSFMIFDNDFCRELTLEYINIASASDLQRFKWIHDSLIGNLPLKWNHLVGEYEENPNAKIYHYTNGGPWHPKYYDCDHADLWLREYKDMTGNEYPRRS